MQVRYGRIDSGALLRELNAGVFVDGRAVLGSIEYMDGVPGEGICIGELPAGCVPVEAGTTLVRVARIPI